MNCPNCTTTLKMVTVAVAGAKNNVTGFQCPKCDYFSFEPASSQKVLEELHESPLKIKQKLIKLSHDRLGIYFNANIIRSLELKNGADVYISIPDKKHIIIELPS